MNPKGTRELKKRCKLGSVVRVSGWDGVAARSTKNDSVASRVRQKAEDVRTSTTTSFRKGNRINKAEMMQRCLTTGSPTAVQQLLLYLRTTMAASGKRPMKSRKHGGRGARMHAPNKPLVLSCCVSGRKEQAGGAAASLLRS